MKNKVVVNRVDEESPDAEVPEGWVAATMEEIGDLYCGQSPATGFVNTTGLGTPYMTGPDQWNGSELHVDKWTTDPRRTVPDGCIFVTVKGAGVGTIFPGVRGAIGRDIYAFKPAVEVHDSFIRRAHEFTVSEIKRNAAGDIPGLSKDHLLKHSVNVPPPEEQKRIIAAIDNLFVLSKSARDHLSRVPTILKRFRQAVLAAACSGRLTEDWRKAKQLETDDWTQASLEDVADLRLGKMLDQRKNVGSPTLYIRNVNVRWFSFDLDSLLNMRATKRDQVDLSIMDGDLLLCEGGEPGRCAVWNLGANELIFQKAIHRIRLKPEISPHWVAFNLKNDADSGILEEYFTGSGIRHLTGRSLATYSLSV